MVEQTVSALVKNGFKVASVKHTVHATSADREGKDTWRHWVAGSDPVIFSSSIETTMIKHSGMRMDDITRLVMTQFHPDVLLIEGCKNGEFPKIALGRIRPKKGTVMVNPNLKRLVGYIEGEVEFERTMADLPGLDCGKCGFDCAKLARRIISGKSRLSDCKELSDLGVEVTVGGNRLAAGKFVSEIVNDTVRGMLGSLKGYEPGKLVEIRLEPKRKKSRRRT